MLQLPSLAPLQSGLSGRPDPAGRGKRARQSGLTAHAVRVRMWVGQPRAERRKETGGLKIP